MNHEEKYWYLEQIINHLTFQKTMKKVCPFQFGFKAKIAQIHFWAP
jgi:hypothetical protein